MAVQGELTNLSGKNLIPTTEERGEGEGKNKTKQMKTNQTKKPPKQPTKTNNKKSLGKITTPMIPETFETCKTHTWNWVMIWWVFFFQGSRKAHASCFLRVIYEISLIEKIVLKIPECSSPHCSETAVELHDLLHQHSWNWWMFSL